MESQLNSVNTFPLLHLSRYKIGLTVFQYWGLKSPLLKIQAALVLRKYEGSRLSAAQDPRALEIKCLEPKRMSIWQNTLQSYSNQYEK